MQRGVHNSIAHQISCPLVNRKNGCGALDRGRPTWLAAWAATRSRSRLVILLCIVAILYSYSERTFSTSSASHCEHRAPHASQWVVLESSETDETPATTYLSVTRVSVASNQSRPNTGRLTSSCQIAIPVRGGRSTLTTIGCSRSRSAILIASRVGRVAGCGRGRASCMCRADISIGPVCTAFTEVLLAASRCIGNI